MFRARMYPALIRSRILPRFGLVLTVHSWRTKREDIASRGELTISKTSVKPINRLVFSQGDCRSLSEWPATLAKS